MTNLHMGDCFPFMRSLSDNSVDSVITDPPFGIDFKYNQYDDSPKEYVDLLKSVIYEINRLVRPGGMCFIFQAQLRLRLTWPLFPDDSRIFAACKNFVQMRPTEVQFSFDPVVFWKKDGKYPRKANGRDFFVSNTSPSSHVGLNNVDLHPCPRPLDVMFYLVNNFTPEDGIVFDPFMGSGTTGVACVQTGRNFVGCEINEEYFTEASQRIARAEFQMPLFA